MIHFDSILLEIMWKKKESRFSPEAHSCAVAWGGGVGFDILEL
jgi:hypothetical protein